MKNILLTTAYSNTSKNALRYTLRVAQYFDAKVTVLHIYKGDSIDLFQTKKEVAEESESLSPKGNIEERQRVEDKKLKTFISENTSKQFYAVPIERKAICDDNVVKQVLAEEEEEEYDLIVIANKTKRHLSDALFGSTASKLLVKTKTPILLIPPMAFYRGLPNITFVSKLETNDFSAIEHLFDWTMVFDSKLHLVHFFQGKTLKLEAEQKKENFLKEFKAEIEGKIVDINLLNAQLMDGVRDYLESSNVDLLVLTTHQRGFFAPLFDTSSSSRIAGDSNMVPVLILKNKFLPPKA